MKKLFFAALVATVAVGGALSANAITFYEEGSNDAIICEAPPTVSCSLLPQDVKYYTTPAEEGQTVEVLYTQFNTLYRAN